MASMRCANPVSTTARSFVQLSRQQWTRSHHHHHHSLEFLLPPRCIPGSHTKALSTSASNRNTEGWRRPITANPGPSQIRHPSRAISTTAPRQATHAIYNPQQDEDGNEMVLEITPRAAKRLSEVMTKDSNPLLALRIQVESGGCHGFQYLMSLVTLPDALPSGVTEASGSPNDGSDTIIRDDDTIFTYSSAPEAQDPPDLTAPKIILDAPSLELLKGSKVDFTMELIGSQFKIIDNPLATSSCGCGTSFDIKS